MRTYPTTPAMGRATVAAMPPSTARSTARSRRRQPSAAVDVRSSSPTRRVRLTTCAMTTAAASTESAVTTHSAVTWKRTARRRAVAHDALRGVRVITVRQLVDRVHHVARVDARGQAGGHDRLHDPDVGMRAEERTGEHHLRRAVVEVGGRVRDTDERRGEGRHGRSLLSGVEVAGDLVLVVGAHLEPVADARAEALGEERRHRAVDGELVRVRRVHQSTFDGPPSDGVVVAGEGVRFEHQAAVAGDTRNDGTNTIDSIDSTPGSRATCSSRGWPLSWVMSRSGSPPKCRV